MRMRLIALRLLALFAVMVMPFGMSAAPAEAATQQHSMAMASEHCPEPDSVPSPDNALATCSMACASALPAAELAPEVSHPLARPSVEPAIVAALAGIELEIATPPPRLS
jgi:hypothetical protein